MSITFHNRVRALAWIGFFLLHAFLVLRVYPPTLLCEASPPLRGDLLRHLAATDAIGKVQGLVGYDPYFLAGYPVGAWNSIGGKGYEVLRKLLPFVPVPALMYGAVVGLVIACPWLAWLGVRRFFPNPRVSRIMLVGAVVYWNISTVVSYFWSFGNILFPTMCFLVPTLVGLAWDILEGRRPRRSAIGLGLLAGAMFYGHPIAFVAGLAPLAMAALWHARRWRLPATWGAFALAVAVAGALAIWWLLPLLAHREDCLALPTPWLQTSWKDLVMALVSDRAYRQPFDRTLLEHAGLVFGLVGLCLAWRQRSMLAVLGVGGLAAFALAYGGSYWQPTANIQPYRFLVPAHLFMLFPAALGLDWAWRRTQVLGRDRALVLVLLLVMLPAFTAYLVDLARPPVPGGLSRSDRAVLAAVSELHARGRVLCDDFTLGHLIPGYCGVPVIGGLQPYLKHFYATVDQDGSLGGRQPDDWDVGDLRRHLARYAVDVAVFSRPAWLAYAARHASLFTLERRVAGRALYRIVNAEPSLVREGAAEVTADYDRIEVRQVRAEVLDLKLHAASDLVADQGVRLERVTVGADPVPFIRCRVPAGVTAFTIRKVGAPAWFARGAGGREGDAHDLVGQP